MKKNTTKSRKHGSSLLLVLICILMNISAEAQIFRGDKYFEKHDYLRALEAYEKAYVDNFSNSYLTRKIADSYRNLGDTQTSLVWYKRTLEMDQSEQADMLHYAQALKSIEDYSESQKWYKYYGQLRPEDSRAASHMRDDLYYIKLRRDSAKFNINRLEMNTDKPEFGISRYGDKMLFSSAGVENPGMRAKWDWEDPYMDVYEGKLNDYGEMVDIKKLEGNVNSKFHDGPVWYNGEHGELYITRNNEKNGKPVLDEHGRVNLKIYRCLQSGGKWGKAEELSLNSNDFSNAHPTVSADGNKLYFSSNRPGGIGGNDIYMCSRIGDDWSIPVNMGRPINSEGDEMFPTTATDGRLYFASDGHAGLGAMDIFYTEYHQGLWKVPTNMGYPVNTSSDDFGMVAEPGGKSGYFSSNRGEHQLQDDIYRFMIRNTIRIRAEIAEKAVLDGFDYGLLRMYSEDGEFVGFFGKDKSGDAIIEMDKLNGKYTLVLESENWEADTMMITIDDSMGGTVDIGKVEPKLVSYAALPTTTYEYSGSTTDFESSNGLSGVSVTVYDERTGNIITSMTTDGAGDFRYNFEPGIEYRLEFEKEGYHNKTEKLMATNDQGNHSLNDLLDLRFTKIELGAALDVANIYYDFDKSNIRSDARPELDKLVSLLEKNTKLNIAINSHTDSRGAAEYNKYLSQKRAESVVEYLVNNGIDRNRLVAKGYGEEALANDCNGQRNCSNNEHQENRRTEFIVLGM